MASLHQIPAPGESVLACCGDVLEVHLQRDQPAQGRAVLRTNLGRCDVRHVEIIAHNDEQKPFLAGDWHDIPMEPVADGRFRVRVPLLDPGWYAAKACFIAQGSRMPEWPEGENLSIKVEPASSACANTLYTAFVRQFGATHGKTAAETPDPLLTGLDAAGYTVIPPSGTFRDLGRQLDTIIGRMGFRILQLLPIHPVPTTYGRMGRYGSPFANLDFLAVDPALAEFDRRTTPLDQFRELADAVHSRGARIFLDLPANHTGWASTLQTHKPEWFRRTMEGSFKSPGAWGTVWEDLVELDYRHPELRAYMAQVFLFWCRQGVDGFRCDAGYMVPAETWSYIVARVRQQFPDTIFLLEGLGGELAVTERLLSSANLDWAYSEVFQIEDRVAMERYLPAAIALSERTGPLVHFAETHDNVRLATYGEAHARMRTALAALLSQAGAFGISNGVEWFAETRVDVHGSSPLNWGSRRNQLREIARLNALLAIHPAFASGSRLRLIHRGDGNALAVLRMPPGGNDGPPLLVLANLDAHHVQRVSWPTRSFPADGLWDLLADDTLTVHQEHGVAHLELGRGQVRCLADRDTEMRAIRAAARGTSREPESLVRRRRNLLALRVRHWLSGEYGLPTGIDSDRLGESLAADPLAFCGDPEAGAAPGKTGLPAVTTWRWPADQRRCVMLPPGHVLMVLSPEPFRVRLDRDDVTLAADDSVPTAQGNHLAMLRPGPDRIGAASGHVPLTLRLDVYGGQGVTRGQGPVLALAPADRAEVLLRHSGAQVRADGLYALLANGRGAMAQVRAAWGEIRSQYDALLAANLDPRVPVDRRVFFTRCRAWVQQCGYSTAVDSSCLAWFEAEPGGTRATWRFHVPTGMGCWVPLTFSLRMIRGRNRVVLNITREAAEGNEDVLSDETPIVVVLRPDVEARSFHHKTKAYAGPEREWPAAVQPQPDGFLFRPAAGETYSLRADVGVYHHAPEWTYMVPHPEEAERGLDGSSDLFSPGWFGIELRAGQRAHLQAEAEEPTPYATAEATNLRPPGARLPLGENLLRGLDAYVVRRDELRTVIAGYPWFLDWGRDTLIVLRGLIAAGHTTESLDILREFGRLERLGTLPNMIRGSDDSNRDTSDAPLWLAVAAADLIETLGAAAVLQTPCGARKLADVLVSIITHYRSGTPNGIGMDAATGLIFSPSHFTWMDTNFPAATPRMGYPVEIQALWIAALDVVRRHIDPSVEPLQRQAQASLLRLFTLPDGWLADCLRASPGTGAEAAQPLDALRPNQLLAITLGAVQDRRLAGRVINACERLLVPGAIRSLADQPVRVDLPIWRDGHLLNDPHHPYCGSYRGNEDTHRKPAYHNGTAWTWPFPLYCEALLRVYGAGAAPTAASLLASSTELLNRGCIGHLPEIVDGDAPHADRGCGAQAWGASELLRVWKLAERLRSAAGSMPASP